MNEVIVCYGERKRKKILWLANKSKYRAGVISERNLNIKIKSFSACIKFNVYEELQAFIFKTKKRRKTTVSRTKILKSKIKIEVRM